MTAEKLDLFSMESGLSLFRQQVETYVNIPLVAEGQKVVVDETALEGIWQTDIARFIPPTIPPAKYRQLKGALVKHFNRSATPLAFNAGELEQEAAEPKRTLVMAEPDKITSVGDHPYKVQVYKSWLSARHALVKAGAHLDILDTTLGAELDVFTRDRYLLIGKTAYLPDTSIFPRGAERTAITKEVAMVRAGLEARGVDMVLVRGAWFEGGNVIRHFGSRTIFVGTWDSPESLYTEKAAQKLITAINGVEKDKWSLVKVPLSDIDYMYHMDTGMSEELPRGEILLSKRLTDAATYRKICGIVGTDKVIELSDRDAENLATNLIDVGNTLIMTSNVSKELAKELTDRGYKPVTPANYGAETFGLSRGGVHCMTNDLPAPQKKRTATQINRL